MWFLKKVERFNLYVRKGAQRPSIGDVAQTIPQYKILSMTFKDLEGDFVVFEIQCVRKDEYEAVCQSS